MSFLLLWQRPVVGDQSSRPYSVEKFISMNPLIEEGTVLCDKQIFYSIKEASVMLKEVSGDILLS
ncbi:MAG TPA: hypothetical protein PKD65_15250, partial [Nitrospira sp.]|nr:hypothetical protein [Nitrospira sp.]